MALRDALLPELDQEAAGTRRTLERVPDDKFAWKPHPKSFSMGDLAGHVANILQWTVLTLNADNFDLAPPGQEPMKPERPNSQKELLEMFDRNLAAARTALSAASDEQLLAPWTLLSGGKQILKMPRIAVLRSFILNHSIHHRAQLGVYLRLNDLPVPSLYGGSADEPGM
jgi:uncharacterized damage-inducible protein DinB